MAEVSEESLLESFCSGGGGSGRLRNADLLKTFKPFIGHPDPQLRAKYREEFKLNIDRIAVVKSENGEKYLVLKKKYRQLLQEREARHSRADVDAQGRPSSGTAPWDGTGGTPVSSGRSDTRALQPIQHAPPSCPVVQVQYAAPSSRDDDLDKDPGSKSESEQDEESTGSVGSAAVALDPIEKEWIYSAAGARVPDLSQLLRQDPSLANKKDFTSVNGSSLGGQARQQGHGRSGGRRRRRRQQQIGEGYTPLHIAALHGHQHILDLLMGTYGAKANLRDYSGHLAFYYLKMKEPEGPEDDGELPFQATQARDRNRNRKLASLFHSKKKWGSAEELAPIEEERTAPPQLILPAFRPRKFSR
uniref:SOWAHA-C winged helix-turn-helix domain-containing protein n=1 Tax=Tetraodon nigroviridis TaxID=99883 RepID=H3D4I4_TETNG